jgi:hypothetical protein
MLLDGKSWVRIFFKLLNLCSRTMILGFTKFLTEIRTRNLPGGKARPTRKADNLNTTCEIIIYRMWDLDVSPPQSVTGVALFLFT